MTWCSYIVIALVGCSIVIAFHDEIPLSCRLNQNELSDFVRETIKDVTEQESGTRDKCICIRLVKT